MSRSPLHDDAGPDAPMVFVHGGGFRMGSEDFYPDERPVRDAQVGDFWMDATPVTNAAFARFVAETGYVTVAEIKRVTRMCGREFRPW